MLDADDFLFSKLDVVGVPGSACFLVSLLVVLYSLTFWCVSVFVNSITGCLKQPRAYSLHLVGCSHRPRAVQPEALHRNLLSLELLPLV